MKAFGAIVKKLSEWMQAVSGAALVFIMLLTVADVCLRNLVHKPIIGTFEMVGLGGAVVIGFAVPVTSWFKGHIFVDFLIQSFSKRWRAAVTILTRVLCILLFSLMAWNLILYANDLYISGEVTLTRRLPFYPVAYGLAACCILQCIVLIADILKIHGGPHE